MSLLNTSTVHSNFRITIKKNTRSKMDDLKLGDIIGFYETPEGILIKKMEGFHL